MIVNDIKKIIGRYPRLNLLIRRTYWFFWYAVIKLAGQSTTSYREKKYSRKCAPIMNSEWLNHKSKKLFCDRICRERPFESLCEVGCNAGANLVLLAKEWPSANYVGVDINGQAVDYGNAYFAGGGLSNVKLIRGRVENLNFIENKSFDIVVTNALLCLMDQEHIIMAVKELIRIAKQKIILFELNYADKYDGKGVFRDGYWIRDYLKCFNSLGYKDSSISSMPWDAWESAVWKMYGAIISVNL